MLTIEEPETHLHPHAIRNLARKLSVLDFQTVISTHSPFFVQNTSVFNLRLLRKRGNYSDILYLQRNLKLHLEPNRDIKLYCNHKNYLEYSEHDGILVVTGKIQNQDYQTILSKLKTQKEQKRWEEVHQKSKLLIDSDEIRKFDIFVKRIRGDILFADLWVLCEGQSEFEFYNFIYKSHEFDLDSRNISIIDYKNNGNPEIFVKLATIFEISWIFTHDNDTSGQEYLANIEPYKDMISSIGNEVLSYPDEIVDFEDLLVKSPLRPLVIEIIQEDKSGDILGYYETEEIKYELQSDSQNIDNILIFKIEGDHIEEISSEDTDYENYLNLILRQVFQTKKVPYTRKLMHKLDEHQYNIDDLEFISGLFEIIKELSQ